MDFDKFLRANEEVEKIRRIERQIGQPLHKLFDQHRISETNSLVKVIEQQQQFANIVRTQDILKMTGATLGISAQIENITAARALMSKAEIATGLVKLVEAQGVAQTLFSDAAKAASLAAVKAFAKIDADHVKLSLGVPASKIWREQLASLGNEGFEHKLGNHLFKSIERSVFAQAAFADIGKAAIGSAFMRVPNAAHLAAKAIDFSHSYKTLFQSFEASEAKFLSLPPTLSAIPAVELFNGAALLKSTSTNNAEDDDFIESTAEVREEIRIETKDALDRLLYEINPAFLTMREGARQALKSENPDRVRHFTVSYRELFTHILHNLAPDDEVKNWTTDKNHFSNNRPTRKARFLYICRHLNQRPFEDFVQKDIEAALVMLNFFQQGTHQIISNYTPVQIAALEARMEGVMRFLLEIKCAEQSE